ncbi:MAG TPA: CAP domain-containing protein [Actinomycetota bacterium]|nr:CAP domain-containing protein [Actinomycetota bacterium]
MRKVASILFAGAVLATLLPAGSAVAADNPCWTYKTSEKGFNRKMNGARTNAGLGKLSLDPELSKAARVHTKEMVTRNELYHTPSDKLRNRVTNWIILGENVGVGSTVASLHQAFMDSPAHRENIMNATFRHVGIGVLKKNGRMWVTVIFEAVTDPGTPLSMPKC